MTGVQEFTPAQLRRLGALERIVLEGTAGAAEITEYQRLSAAHEAWMVTTPEYAAWVAALPAWMRRAAERSEAAPRPGEQS